MTENEAIRHLEDLQRLYLGNEKFTADIEAIGIVIKALEQQPCEDCISRAKAINALDEHKYSNEFCEEHNIDWSVNLDMVHILLNELPSVTPTRPTARWERLVEDYNKCSKCGKMGKLYRIYKYCPNCGARMETETKNRAGLNFADQDTMMSAT